MDFIYIVKQILIFLTVAGQILLVVLAFSFLVKQKTVLNYFTKYALHFAFLVALIATVGSLFYSEVAGYEPCKLCWFQRILMYPQVIILGIALLKRDYSITLYSIALSVIGAIIAGYHYLLQIGVASSSVGCSVVGYSVSCAQRFVMSFGYITIPMMALTAFILIIAFMVTLKLTNYEK